jgi:hypothetical protein
VCIFARQGGKENMKNVLLIGLAFLIIGLPVINAESAVSGDKIQSQADRLWLTSVTAAPGETVIVDIMVENAVQKIDAVTIRLRYDTDKLQYMDWEDGTLNPGWVMFNINESEPGLINLGGFCVQTAIEPGSKGSLARMSFKVKPEASGAPGFITVEALRDDLKEFTFDNGKIDIGITALGK